MVDKNSLVALVIEDSVLLLADHARSLRELSGVLAARGGEFAAGWKAMLELDSVWKRTPHLNELAESGTQALVHALGGNTDLKKYLEAVAAWGAELHAGGTNYLNVIHLMMTLRRALTPFVLRNLNAGPEMEVAFAALDAHERAVLNVMAALFIETTQEQMMQDGHQRAIGRLSGGLAHALNNSIAVIIGQAQILEEQVDSDAVREELRAIQKSARAGADSLKRLQHFAVDGTGQGPTRLDVNLLINDIVQLTRFRWRDEAEASGIDIEVVKDLVSVPPVLGQAGLLCDALVELILNGIEAMPLGGLLTIRTDTIEDQVRIAIADQGAGMDTATQARAGQPFFTTKGSGHMGLGLPTVEGIVRKMGGKFSLTSVREEGTTALISLPAASEIKMAPDLVTARLARWAKILIVDDEPLVRDVAVRTFRLHGFHIVAAESGGDAVRLSKEQGPFEVVIVDLGMPGMNGFDTARAIKEIHPRTIVILLTGWASELDVTRMREVGIDRAVAKPFDIDYLIQLVGEALAFQEKL